MNKCMLMGRLTREPEMRQTPNGVAVARFAIAVQRRFAKEGQQQADFIECVAWRQTAEFLCRYFHKGSMVAIVGSIQSRSWEDQNKQKRYATEVVADEVHFTGEKQQGNTQNTYDGFNQQSNTQNPYGGFNQPAPDFGSFANTDFAPEYNDDDLPF